MFLSGVFGMARRAPGIGEAFDFVVVVGGTPGAALAVVVDCCYRCLSGNGFGW